MTDNTSTKPPEKTEMKGVRRIQSIELPSGIIHLNHLQQGTSFIFYGLAADLPTDGRVAPAFFAIDNGNLYLWNGTTYIVK